MNDGDEQERHCRKLAIHEPHRYVKRDVGWFSCPGIPHDHDRFCCTEHGTHHSPHIGCILR